jgi:hypothetical protein
MGALGCFASVPFGQPVVDIGVHGHGAHWLRLFAPRLVSSLPGCVRSSFSGASVEGESDALAFLCGHGPTIGLRNHLWNGRSRELPLYTSKHIIPISLR